MGEEEKEKGGYSKQEKGRDKASCGKGIKRR
jgi:hypothetical protein